MKYLIIVSLILAILTIGVASASQDIDELADSTDDSLSLDDSDVVSEGEEEGDGGDDPAVDVTVYGDDDGPITEDDYEENGEYIVADIDAPKNATGKVAVIVNNDDNPVFVSNLTSLDNDADDLVDSDVICYYIYLSQLNYEFVNNTQYSITVKYFDGNYESVDESGKLTFAGADDQSELEDPELYIDYDYENDYLIGDNRGVTVQVSGQLSNNVTVLLNGEEIFNITTDKWQEGYNGYYYSFDLRSYDLIVGENTIKVTYAGDETYKKDSYSETVDATFIKVNDEYMDGGSMYIYLADGATGTVEIFVNDTSVLNKTASELKESSYVSFDELPYGEYTYKITYRDDDKYSLDEPIEGDFEVSYYFEVYYGGEHSDDDNDYDIGENVTFYIDIVSDAKGPVIVSYNGKNISVIVHESEEDYDGSKKIIINDLPLGETEITFSYKDDKYPLRTIEKTVVINPIFDVPKTVKYAGDELITLVLPQNATGNLIIKKGKYNETTEEYDDYEVIGNVTLVDGKATYSLAKMPLGEYELLVYYDGDDYKEYIEPEEVKVNIIPNVNVPEYIYNETENFITVILPDDVNDNLTAVICDEEDNELEIYNAVANGTVNIKIPANLSVGKYSVYLTYGEETIPSEWEEDYGYYFDLEVRGTNPVFELNVTFPDVVAKIDDEDYDYEYGPFSFNVTGIPEDADGNIHVYINGELYGTYEAYNGRYDFGYSLVKFGSYNTWEVKFADDSYYKETSKNGTFFADWVNVPENLDNGDEITVSLTDKKGFVQFDIDGKNYATEMLDDGSVIFDIKGLSIGNHTYEITYFDENNVKQLSKSGSFKTDYEFSTDIEYGEYAFTKEFEVEIYLPTDATGVITVSVAGKNYTATPVNGTATVILENLVMGENNVTITYAGDSKYPDKELKEVINMTGYEIIVKYEDPEDEDGFVYVSISLPENANGNLTIYNAKRGPDYDWVIDGESIWSVPLEKGFLKLTLDNFTSKFGFGVYDFIARYVSSSEEPDYEVDDVELHFDIVPDVNLTKEIVMGENATVTIIIPNATGVIKVYEDIDDELNFIMNISSDNGTFKGAIPGLKLGEHILIFEYVGDDMENMFNMHVGYSVDVTPKKAEIPEEFNADGSGEIALELPEGANGTVSVYEVDDEGNIIKTIVKDAPYTSENKSVAVSGLSTGYHNIKVVYKDDKNGEFEKETEITVPKPDAGANFKIPDTISGDTLDITLPKDATGNVLVTVDGKTSMMPLVNGSAKVDLSNLSDGAHTITVKYYGDGNFSGFEKSANMTIKRPVDPKITASNLNILYTASTKYTVTIYGTDGNVAANTQVTFLINGKVYKNVKTNAKGIASVAITQKPGTYKITTKALGKEVTKALKVKHIVKLQKVKVKRSAKKLVIKVTLSKVNGKYIKKQKVTLKFKGKKYTAKTNSKGVAKFTIKKNVLKKLKKGKKVTYTATYKKDTVKKTVKVQK